MPTFAATAGPMVAGSGVCRRHWSASVFVNTDLARMLALAQGAGADRDALWWIDRSGNEMACCVVVRARPGYSAAQTPSGRLLRRSAHPEDRPAVCTRRSSPLSHACWLVFYPLAGWLGQERGFLAFVVHRAAAIVALVPDPRCGRPMTRKCLST